MTTLDENVQRALNEARQGWIPASIYSDPAIFEEEKRRLFSRTWQFLAHESELPNIGDYVVRNVLNDSFIVSRGEDNAIRVFLNVCRHRAGQVCRNESGNTRRFLCPYHAWSYKSDGSLAGVPYHDEAYDGEKELRKEEYGLYPAPRMEMFNGLIFINLDHDAQSFEDYMGDYAKYLAFYFPPSPRRLEVRGPQRWRFGANWKIPSENFSGDTYHTPHTHASTGAIRLVSSAATTNRRSGINFAAGRGNGSTFRLEAGSFAERMRSIGYPDDHIERIGQSIPAELRAMIEKEGVIPSATTLFPNFSLLHIWARVDDEGHLAPFTTIRVWRPISATETEIMTWFVVDQDMTEEFKANSYKAYIMSFGTSGMFEQDDMDAWTTLTRMTRGYMSSSVHLHARMGLRADGSELREPLKEFSGPGLAYLGFNEFNQRRWFKFWAEHLEMEPPAPPVRLTEPTIRQAAE